MNLSQKPWVRFLGLMAAVTLLGAGVAAFVILVSDTTAKDPNVACAGHRGVNRLESKYIICRDGYATQW